MLDLSRIAPQVDAIINRLRAGSGEREAQLAKALGLIKIAGTDFENLKRKVLKSRTTWLIAGLVEPPGGRITAPEAPSEFTVLATDGSQIDVDRHQSTRCFLINIGRVRLDYGPSTGAVLESLPALYADQAELYMTDGLHEQAVEGNLLGIKRGIEELVHLTAIAGGVARGRAALALVDGSFILWGLAGEKYPAFVVEQLLEKGYLKALDDLRRAASGTDITAAAYISYPRSTDVANVLRLMVCPQEIADCDRHCKSLANGQRPCAMMAGLQDRDIFSRLLKEGERSALFFTQSKIVNERYGQHRVFFFYLKLDGEIARVEMPEWIALDKRKLGLAHALLLDQCRRGQGYPVALSEAHEQAVVTTSDRSNFLELLDTWFVKGHILQFNSAKSQSKRTRWI